VDDEEPIRALVAHSAERLGFTPTMVSDGIQAVAAVQADPGSWTVVILDLKLPGIDGIEALRRIRVLRPDLPVILMSGYHRNTPPSGPEAAVPTGFLSKPFTLEMLVQQLRETLKL
jgi:CheY-like chemotaxis protein